MNRPVNAMLLTMLIWGIGPVFIRSLSLDLGPTNALLIRYALVGIGFAVGLCVVTGKRIERNDWPRIVFISLVGVLGYNLGSVFGFELVPASIGGIIIGTQPLLIVLMAAIIFRTPPSPAAMIGLLIAFAGTIVLFWNDLSFAKGNGKLALGALYVFLSGFAWAIYVVLAKPLILKYGTYRISAITILIASVPLLAFVSADTFETIRTMSLRSWAEMLYMVVIASLIATVTWNYAAARLSSVATGAFLYLVPVIAVLAGAVILNETVTLSMAAAGALILLGVAVAQYSDRITDELRSRFPNLSTSSFLPYAALLLAVVMWGLVPVALRYLVKDMRPETILFLRLFPAGLFAVLILLAVGMKPMARQDWQRLVLAALLGNCGYQILAHFGIETVPASWTGIIFSLEPLFVALFAVALAREQLTAQLVTGMAIALAGVGILSLGSASSVVSNVGLMGLMLVFLSTMGWGIYTVLIRPLAIRYGSFEISCLTLAVSGLFMALFIRPGIDSEIAELSMPQWGAMGFLVIFGTLFAVILWNYGITRIESSAAGMFLYVQPAVAGLGGVLLLSETVTWPLIAGGAIVLAGVAISQWKQVQLEAPRAQVPERLRTAVERLVASSKESQRIK
ncbi:MAG TPA: DMT family transporter [Aestuariivirgaceae bacterium]|jgi:drug/metabolite transporter (DMT)-like permease